MTKIAIVGHRNLPPDTSELVDNAVRDELSRRIHGSHHNIVGITCLAPGAQQLFARAVADLGGELNVVVPTEKYRDHLPEDDRPEYDSLIAHARAVHRLPAPELDEAAYREADYFMLVLADQLLAVWDGTNPRGQDTTANLVTAAQERGLPVTVIWPAGAQRHEAQRGYSSVSTRRPNPLL